MAGFGSTMSKLIEDDREYYRELATKKRDYLQTYGTKAVLDRDEKANGALSVFNTLVTAGIPEEDLRYVLNTTGVPGLSQLSNTLKSRSDLTKAEIAGLVKKSKDYVAENPDEDISDILRRAYGLYESTDKPVEREANIFSAVLGLDSRMMEREALNDVYIDGFKGTDLYAIMARGGPKSGEALSLNLPTKPPSTQTLAASFKSLTTKFETSIDGKIRAATRANNFPLVEKLEKLKARGVEGIYDYATLPEIGDPTLLDFAKSIELETPGAVSRNSIYLGGFTSQFNSWYGDQQDDTKLEGSGQPLPAKIIDTGEIKTYTPTELRAALSEGELAVGSTVVVNGNEVVITQAQVNKGEVKGPGMTTGEGLTLEKDGDSLLPPTPGLTDDDMGLPDSPVVDTIAPAISSGAATSEWLDSVNPIPSTEDLNTGLVTANYKVASATTAGLATAIDFLTGFVGGAQETTISRNLKKLSKTQAERAAKVAALGFTEYFSSDSPPEEVLKEIEDAYTEALIKEEESIIEAMREKTLRLQAMNEGVRVLPEVEPVTKDPSATYEYTDQPVPMGTAAEPEPLVARPKKPKEMTSSDKARLKRAQKANELSGDSALLEMLVEKYGIAIVQKEMGL